MSTYLFSFGRETALTFSFCTFIPGTKCSNQDMGIAWHGAEKHTMHDQGPQKIHQRLSTHFLHVDYRAT
jgi:hypothetical protein